MPEANAPALAALAKAVALKDRASAKERALIEALEEAIFGRSQGRAPGARQRVRRCDAAGRQAVPERRYDSHALRRERDGHAAVGLLGARRREGQGPGRRDRLHLETVLKRNPNHPGAIHLYIHAVEASTHARARAAARASAWAR